LKVSHTDASAFIEIESEALRRGKLLVDSCDAKTNDPAISSVACWALKGVDHEAALRAGVIGADRPAAAAGSFP